MRLRRNCKNAPASARSRSNLKQSSRFVGSSVATPNLYKKIQRDTNRYPVVFAEGRGRTDTRCDPHQILSLARLPIPSLRHEKQFSVACLPCSRRPTCDYAVSYTTLKFRSYTLSRNFLGHEVLLYVISNIFFFQVLNFVLYLILTRGIGYAHY